MSNLEHIYIEQGVPEKEVDQFGHPVEKESALESIYGYLTLDDMHALELDFGVAWTLLNNLDSEAQLEDIGQELSLLSGYKAKRDQCREDVVAINALKQQTRPPVSKVMDFLARL